MKEREREGKREGEREREKEREKEGKKRKKEGYIWFILETFGLIIRICFNFGLI